MTYKLKQLNASVNRFICILISIIALGTSHAFAQRHYAIGSVTDPDISKLIENGTYFCLSFNGYTLGYVGNTGTNKDKFPYKCIAVEGEPRIFTLVTVSNPKKSSETLTCLATFIDGECYYLYFVNGNEWYMSTSLEYVSSQQRLVSVDETTGKLYIFGNPGWSSSEGSRRYLYITANGELGESDGPAEWEKPELSSYEKPQIEFVPIYNSTLKGKNNKINSATDKGDMDVDRAHVFVGVVVKSVWENSEATGVPNGFLSEEKITDAIESEIVSSGYAYSEDDPLRGILYVDMKTYLNKVDQATTSPWSEFDKKTADNCLYFMPKLSEREGFDNFVSDNTSCADIIIKDRQPFFNPMEFDVNKDNKVSYTRVITGGDESTEVTQGSLILPFAITLEEGSACGVTFYDLGEVAASDEPNNQTYNVSATPVATTSTEANKPYHISVSAGPALYTIEQTGATIAATPDSHRHIEGGSQDMSLYMGGWTACGNYCGESSLNADNKYFYNSGYFWLSSNQKNYSDILVGPFRAYFNSSVPSGVKIKINLEEYDATTRIDVVKQDVDNLIIHNLRGEAISADSIGNLSRGIYIVNGKKVVIK